MNNDDFDEFESERDSAHSRERDKQNTITTIILLIGPLLLLGLFLYNWIVN